MRLVKLFSVLTSITMLFISCTSEHKLEKASTKDNNTEIAGAKTTAQQVSLTVNGMT